MRRLVVLTS